MSEVEDFEAELAWCTSGEEVLELCQALRGEPAYHMGGWVDVSSAFRAAAAAFETFRVEYTYTGLSFDVQRTYVTYAA